eukprot:m.125324 g.125324  ORF g.125324 m.125324 type:complete len:62 (+) comp17322_c0_seq5:955-1140(+)
MDSWKCMCRYRTFYLKSTCKNDADPVASMKNIDRIDGRRHAVKHPEHKKYIIHTGKCLDQQ